MTINVLKSKISHISWLQFFRFNDLLLDRGSVYLGPKLGTTNFNMLHFDVWLYVPGKTYVDFLWQRIFVAQKEVSIRKVNGIDFSGRFLRGSHQRFDEFRMVSRTYLVLTPLYQVHLGCKNDFLPPRGSTFTGIPNFEIQPKRQKQLNIWETSDYLMLVQSDPSPFQTSL